jgi:hypothetical protein
MPAAPFTRDALAGHDVVFGTAAQIFRGDLLQLLDPVARRGVRARVIACVVWLPPDTQLHGRFLEVSPQVTVHFSQGMPIISAATR